MIYHLADLTIKAGMKSLTLNIDQLFLLNFFFTSSSTAVNGRKNELIHGILPSFLSQKKKKKKKKKKKTYSNISCHVINLKLKKFRVPLKDWKTSYYTSIFLSYILPSMDRFNIQKSTELHLPIVS